MADPIVRSFSIPVSHLMSWESLITAFSISSASKFAEHKIQQGVCNQTIRTAQACVLTSKHSKAQEQMLMADNKMVALQRNQSSEDEGERVCLEEANKNSMVWAAAHHVINWDALEDGWLVLFQ